MSASRIPFAATAEEGKPIWFLGSFMTLKAASESTGNSFSMMEQLAAPGFATPYHVHHAEDEWFYILEGEVTFFGRETIHAGPGDSVYLPREVAHAYRIDGDKPAKLLIAMLPGGLEAFFEEGGDPATERTLPPPQEPDFPRIMALAGKYHLEILGPPPSDA